MSTPSKPGWIGYVVEKKEKQNIHEGFVRVGRWRKEKQKMLELTASGSTLISTNHGTTSNGLKCVHN
jgi:hypothetical protein